MLRCVGRILSSPQVRLQSGCGDKYGAIHHTPCQMDVDGRCNYQESSILEGETIHRNRVAPLQLRLLWSESTSNAGLLHVQCCKNHGCEKLCRISPRATIIPNRCNYIQLITKNSKLKLYIPSEGIMESWQEQPSRICSNAMNHQVHTDSSNGSSSIIFTHLYTSPHWILWKSSSQFARSHPTDDPIWGAQIGQIGSNDKQ